MVIQKPHINIVTCILDEDRRYVYEIEDVLKENDIDNFIAPSNIESFIKDMTEDIHICILEYNLDDSINGLEIMKQILLKNPYCYIIMMSSQEDIDIVTEFYDREGFRYIRKGSDDFIEKLIAAVKKAKAIIQRNLDFYFEVIGKFNKTQEIFNNARNTIDSSIGSHCPTNNLRG